MTNYWMLQAMDGSNRVDLYTMTTDETIKVDLEAEAVGGSLIAFARQSNLRSEFTEETNHFDQAVGSLTYHCDTVRRYSRDGSSVVKVDAIPEGLEPQGLGGHSLAGYQQFAASIYEHRHPQ